MLIGCESLHDILDSDSIVVFDCRFQLGNPDAGREAYLQAHVPGALYLDLNHDLSAPVSVHGGRHPLPSIIEFSEKMSAAGVTDGVTVIVYDANDGMAARAWWLLQFLGHKDVLVLDGGWSAWQKAGYPVSDVIPVPHRKPFVPNIQTDWVLSVGQIESWVESGGNLILVDARAPERYRGDIEPIDPVGGHIPGALNYPWTENLDDNGHWKHPDRIRAALSKVLATEGAEMDTSKLVGMYCGSGVTACTNVLAAVIAGLPRPKLYAGSWSDWCSYSDHPVQTGGNP